MAVGEFAASLITVNVADAVPDALGMNVTVADTLWPAAIVLGNVSPENVNSELFTCAEESVTEPFAADRVKVNLVEEPTVTFPKFKLEGLTFSVVPLDETPVPETPTLKVGFLALLLSVMVAEITPAVEGEKLTFI